MIKWKQKIGMKFESIQLKVTDCPFTGKLFCFSQLIYVGEYSLALDEHWHPGHLCCFYCDESLSQQKFVTVDSKPSCVNCYDKNFANSCQSCGKTIGPGMKDVDVRGKHWHEECFVCSQPECKEPLVSLIVT